VALMGFGTPLLFYAASFWEQTPALLFSSLALFFSLKVLTGGKSNCTNFLLAGFMLGLSTMLREEGYVILAALSCGFLLCGQWRRLPLLMAGWGLVMMPVWIFQYFHYGSIFGAHAAVYSGLAGTLSPVSLIAAKLKNFYVYLFCFGGDSRLTILLVSPFIIASLAGFFKREFRLRRPLVGILLWLCAGSGFVMLVRLLLSHTPVFDCIFTQALFTGTPFLVFFLLGILSLLSSTRIELRFASAFCVAYILGACLLLNQSDMGIIWGARHFLALFPFLLPLCLIVWDKISPDNEKRKIVFSSAFFLIALSVLIQCHGLRTLFLKLEASAALKTAIEASPQGDPVLSDIFWLPEEMGTLFHKRVFLQVNTKHGLAEALQTLKDSGIRSFTMLLSANPDYRVISKDEMGKCLSLMDISPGPEIASPGAEFMRCQLFFCKLK